MMYDATDYLSRKEVRDLHFDAKVHGFVQFRGNSFVRKSDEKISFFSYSTPIIDLYKDHMAVDINAFTHSRTTCRHISQFLRVYAPNIDYYELKDYVVNTKLNSGEVWFPYYKIDRGNDFYVMAV